MSNVEDLYFRWLIERAEGTSKAYERLCWMLHQNTFERRVGNDINRAADGANLRRDFVNEVPNLDPHGVNDLLALDCTWFEMLLALAEALDFLYEGGVKDRFIELITNMGLLPVLFTKGIGLDPNPYDEVDQDLVDLATRRVDENLFEADGTGGLFPLTMCEQLDHPDQRTVEIWDQHAAYFRERLGGVMWTSTN